MVELPTDFKLNSKESDRPSFATSPTSPTPRKRRFLRLLRPRFSIRQFLMFTTLLTVVLAIVIRLERPRQVRIWIHQIGGHSELAEKESPDRIEKWLREYLPREYFDSVIKAKLRTIKNDEIVDRLDAFSQLRWLRLDNSQFDNHHLRSLRKLKWLEVLYLHNTSLDDVGMLHIAELKMLRVLRTDRTSVSDLSIASLIKLPNLEVLYLNDNRISDLAIEKLAKLKKLKCLHLENTGVSSDAIQKLKRLIPNCLILGN